MEKTPREQWMTYDEFAFEFQINGNKKASHSQAVAQAEEAEFSYADFARGGAAPKQY